MLFPHCLFSCLKKKMQKCKAKQIFIQGEEDLILNADGELKPRSCWVCHQVTLQCMQQRVLRTRTSHELEHTNSTGPEPAMKLNASAQKPINMKNLSLDLRYFSITALLNKPGLAHTSDRACMWKKQTRPLRPLLCSIFKGVWKIFWDAGSRKHQIKKSIQGREHGNEPVSC